MSSAFAVVAAGTTCDCSRYRRVLGQLDISIGKLRNAVKFVKAGEQQLTPEWRVEGYKNQKLSL